MFPLPLQPPTPTLSGIVAERLIGTQENQDIKMVNCFL